MRAEMSPPVASPVRVTRPDPENERAQHVLDAAEELFALHGYDGVTVRQIARLARVDVALPNYYFGSKRGLLDAVFHRRAAIFNRSRSDALDAVAALWPDQAPPLREIIGAFLQPIADAQAGGDAGWRNYCRLVAQVNNSPIWVHMMSTHFDQIVNKFVAMIESALPGASRADLYTGYHFLSGSITLAMADTGRIDQLSANLCKSSDFANIYDRMADFYVAGFSHLAGRQSQP